jgi:ribosomal protein S24E
MKIRITEEKDNPAMQRKELKADVDFEGKSTPKLSEVASELARAKGVNSEIIEITGLATAKGRSAGTLRAKLWASVDVKKKFEAHKRKKSVKPAEGGVPEGAKK